MADSELGRSVTEIVKMVNSTLEGRYLPAIEHLRQQLDTGREQMENLLEELETALHEAQQQVDQQLEEWEHGFEEAQQQVNAVTEEVRGKIEQSDTFLNQFRDSLQQISDQFSDNHEQIVGQIDQSANQVQQSHDQTLGRLQQWITDIEAGLEKLGQQHSTVESEFMELQQKGVEHLGNVGQNYQELATQTDQQVINLEQHLDTSMEQTLNQFAQIWQDADGAINNKSGGLAQTLEQFGAAGDQLSSLFEGEAGQVLDKVQQIAQILEQIKPFIELVDQLV